MSNEKVLIPSYWRRKKHLYHGRRLPEFVKVLGKSSVAFYQCERYEDGKRMNGTFEYTGVILNDAYDLVTEAEFFAAAL